MENIYNWLFAIHDTCFENSFYVFKNLRVFRITSVDERQIISAWTHLRLAQLFHKIKQQYRSLKKLRLLLKTLFSDKNKEKMYEMNLFIHT